jgi:hypothetical protein
MTLGVLLLVAALFFQVRKPITKAVVSVRHVFKVPKPQPATKQPLPGKRKVEPPEETKALLTDEMPSLSNQNKPEMVVKKPPSALAPKGSQTQNSADQTSDGAEGLDADFQKAAADKSKIQAHHMVRVPVEKSIPPGKAQDSSKTASTPDRLNPALTVSANPTALQAPLNSITQPEASGRQVPFQQVDLNARSVTVSDIHYRKLFNDWRIAGRQLKGQQKIPLRVENLRDTYELFQMKPVLVVNGQPFADLANGSRIAHGALADFSQTVFLVPDPWRKWPRELRHAGIKPADDIEVRYYMYEFVRKAIYARANRAFAWSQQEGLIARDTPSDRVDVLGRAFVIRQQGGGRFGVLVPIEIVDHNGQSIAVDPNCFSDQSDVRLLQQSGLI